MEIISIIIGFALGLIANIIVVELYKYLQKKNEYKSTLTGIWIQHTYKSFPHVKASTDQVICRHNPKSNKVSGKIKRISPEEENHKVWEFNGKFEKELLYLIYWPVSKKNTSFGTIVMTLNEENREFQGHYVKTSSKISTGKEMKDSTISKKLIEVPISWKQN